MRSNFLPRRVASTKSYRFQTIRQKLRLSLVPKNLADNRSRETPDSGPHGGVRLESTTDHLFIMTKFLLAMAAIAVVSLVRPVKADRVVQAGPTIETVPDSGSTISMLCLTLLGVAVLRRKLRC